MVMKAKLNDQTSLSHEELNSNLSVFTSWLDMHSDQIVQYILSNALFLGVHEYHRRDLQKWFN